jgi:hypothetical protein
MLQGGMVVALAAAGASPSVMAQTIVATGVGTPFELAFWQSIDSSSDPSLYEAYLARFPNGTFGEIARAKIVALRRRFTASSSPAVNAPPAVSPMLTVPVAPPPPPGPPPPPPAAPPVATYTPTVAVAPVAPAPTIAQPAVATQAAPAASAGTLGLLLAALANSQATNDQANAATASAQPAVVQPAPVASRAASAGFAMPAPPTLSPVPAVAFPPSFCSAEARNAFHDTVYAPSVSTAKRNNDAASAYMRQLQSLYDQYQLSHDPDTMNAIVGAARTYQQVAQTTFSMESALVRQFGVLMAVPVVPCSQPGQPPATTLAR